MGERWATRTYERMRAIRGEATVRINTKRGVINILLKDDEGKETPYEIKIASAPEDIRNGRWFVSISGQGDRLLSVTPISGVVYAKFTEFACPAGQLPAPKTYSYEWEGKTQEYLAFTALFTITEGPYKGMQLSKFLRYYFAEEGGMVVFDKPKSKYTAELQDFLETLGAFEKGQMKYSENILPALQARLQDQNVLLQIAIKKGMIDSMVAVEESYVADEDEDEEDTADPTMAALELEEEETEDREDEQAAPSSPHPVVKRKRKI